MKASTFKNSLLVLLAVAAFASKKKDEGEIDKTGTSSDTVTEMNESTTIEGTSSDTVSAGKEGMNGSGIGSGNPNTSGTDDAHQQ